MASFRDGIQAFIEGRTAAAISSVASGMTQQADASVEGVRFLSLPRTFHVSETMWQEEPGFHAVSVSAGFAIGIERDMVLAAKDSYLTAHANVSPSTVYAIVKLLWESIHELDLVHPIFKRWTHADMLNPRVTIPFHEGTVRFLKERGKWTPAHEKTQQELLVKLSR